MVADLPGTEEIGRFSLVSLEDVGPEIIEISLEDGVEDDTSASLESDPVGLLLRRDLYFFRHDVLSDA